VFTKLIKILQYIDENGENLCFIFSVFALNKIKARLPTSANALVGSLYVTPILH